ncbi:MAG: type II toxin-antitoxin system VapC family toxin [Candidatus Altiarchaeales archaeon]|nr:type II toxin-antitoxin system VapC family toxin [Candidatus Altiarchaeota archaeon]MBU4341365.1 type II toxin-antitoxin system VapC family toxin [Candidatus Altiarchaeota archaeon]MBU4406766.1 type II toxin-antitoxin system VapC family toxin [Candidatus Altiarchaeota archaeon]MBU4436842.1 type II toxin-antitoxin system VapC family toxin [Candidatus Altiarchaeota archaeon]MCG2782985.1 type II toxin-antitoxin system VapC family toxin [Candidatus Altiarchaeales archaeon]
MGTLYLDSNILLNVLLEEEDFVESSFELLQDIEAGKYSALTSLLTIMEIHRILQKHGKKEKEIAEVIQKIPGIGIEIIIPEREDMVSSYEFVRTLKIDPADSIHLSVAMESSTIFVTRDEELSKKISSVIKVVKPEEL